jgi:4-hydroxy-3-methylbut-2-enyl diphosphate reductase
MTVQEPRLYRKGFGLKAEVLPILSQSYHSSLVDRMVAGGHALVAGDVTFRLAREFGFCYGVDRAVEGRSSTRTRPAASSPTGGSSSRARSSTIRS